MLRKLLVSTAMAGVLATGAYAQDANTTTTTVPVETQPADADAQTMDMESADSSAQTQGGDYLENLTSEQYLASDLTGVSIYDGEGEDAQELASISNYLVDADGSVVAAIVSVTSSDQAQIVAIPFDQITWTTTEEGEPRATMTSGADQLATLPAFMTPDDQEAAASVAGSTDTSGAATTGTAATGGTAAANDPAMGGAAGSTDMAASPDAEQPASGVATADNDAGDMQETASSDAPTSVGSDQYLSENLIGSNVYSGPGEDADDIGTINDLVMTSSGDVEAAVVGVGGFLGIGQKDVGVPFDMVDVVRSEDDDPRFEFASDRAALEEAPTFSGERPDQMAEGETADTTGDGTLAAGTGAAAGAAAGSAMTETEQTADAAGDNIEGAADSAGETMAEAGNETEQALENTGQDMAQTGAAATGAATGAAGGVAATGAADTQTTASTGGGMQADMQPVTDAAELTADNLLGTSVYGPNNETVGDIGDIALTADGEVDAVIIDVGGFLGIGEKPVAVAMDNLNFMRDAGGTLYLYTQFTEDQLDQAPEYSSDTYAESRDTMRLEDAGSINEGGAAVTEPATAN